MSAVELLDSASDFRQWARLTAEADGLPEMVADLLECSEICERRAEHVIRDLARLEAWS